MRFHRDHRSDWRCRSGATKQAEPKGGGWKLGREADRLLLHASRRDRARNSRRRRPRTEPDRPVLRVPLWYGLGSRDAIKGFAVSGREDSAFLTGDKAQYKVICTPLQPSPGVGGRHGVRQQLQAREAAHLPRRRGAYIDIE
jgi:hypothetical protein